MSGSRKSKATGGSSKTTPFALRLTDGERQELSRRAGEMALGSYIRAVLFAESEGGKRHRGSRAPVKDHVALAEVLACLGQSRIGESLKKLSEAAETGLLSFDPDAPVEIRRATQDILAMRLLLMRALGFQVSDEEFVESVSQSFTRASRNED
ncbi:hypothetical protein OEG84_16950 [Hoeflea sp. G2-23]|uniref:Uncharacterized protein n=1 Tax=Hoeflea algicola TaxID=2983763 RepID=A0ABT3ZC18_9HYPH|nr:hypothetical protein [Hoeflea algicola]MCY0149351.1 hypothetical protein [Hoeflea algicola]